MASGGPPPAWLMIVAALAGLPFTWGVAYSFYAEHKAQKAWARTAAHVVESRVAEKMRSERIKYYALLRYRYRFNGRDYESSRIGNTDGYYSGRGPAQKLADRYPAGAGVIAFVDPANPGNAVLEPGHSWITMAALFLVGLLWAGAWLAAWVQATFPRLWR
jgi:hypothetical protein